jgi:hypothetical protein
LPGFGPEPSYDFVYVTRNYYGNGPSYDIVNGKIVERPGVQFPETDQKYTAPPAQLYLYDVETKSSKNLTATEAQSFRLEPSRTSPDGYIIENGGYNGMFPFSENHNYYQQYLVGHNRRIKTTISDIDFAFLGWVLK